MSTTATTHPTVSGPDLEEVRSAIRAVYEDVARDPAQEFHFDTGRALALRLGYPAGLLGTIPAEALRSFAGVGHPLGLADLQPGERVLDLGSGSGTDAFAAAHLVGPSGSVLGIDMTAGQLATARRLRDAHGPAHLRFAEGHVEQPPAEPGMTDVVISNGVVNLVPDKAAVFRAAARALRPGGRLAISDIVSTRAIKPATRANGQLWAACIAGAVPQQTYGASIEAAGFEVIEVRENAEYRFVSERAAGTAERYGVRSVSLLARRGY